MAESKTTVTIVPLSGKNYPTWKVQCRMALMRENLWSIVDGTELPPATSETEKYQKYVARKNRALAMIVLSVDPALLYLIGDPEDPVTVWKKLADQFQKKTWATKLELRRKLHSLRLKDGDSVQEHVKAMIEVFDGLSVAGDPVSDEDRTVHLLASLPESYNMLVTALEANPEVPKMEVVTERLLHEERKQKERADAGGSSDKALTVERQFRRKGPQCHHCGKFGHIKRNCYDLAKAKRSGSQKVNKAEVKRRDSSSSDSESAGMLVCHALSVSVKN